MFIELDFILLLKNILLAIILQMNRCFFKGFYYDSVPVFSLLYYIKILIWIYYVANLYYIIKYTCETWDVIWKSFTMLPQRFRTYAMHESPYTFVQILKLFWIIIFKVITYKIIHVFYYATCNIIIMAVKLLVSTKY